MPTQTFLNLDETKKQRIIDQTVFLILNHPISEITISMIVKEASIPRGSFYQ
jgi:AcrR family transcriptional regulator